MIKKIRKLENDINKANTVLGSILYFFVSIYGGFFGAGTGIFARYVLMLCFKMKMITSNATDLVVGFLSTIFSLYLLLHSNFINWRLGLIMFAGMLIGGWFGAHTANKKGDDWVSIVFVFVTLAMSAKLIFFGL